MSYLHELDKLYDEEVCQLPQVGTVGDGAESIAPDMESISEPPVLLSDTKNTVETITLPAAEKVLVNGKYFLESEDEKYYYCTYTKEYETKIIKDEAKANIRYRNAKGQLLPGYSLVRETEGVERKPRKQHRKKVTEANAQAFLDKGLLPFIVALLEDGDMSDKEKSVAALTLFNYVKPKLSSVDTTTVIRLQNDEFGEPDNADEPEADEEK